MKAALVIVDVQRYYLDPASSFCSYTEYRWPGSTDFIHKRVNSVVLSSILQLRQAFDNEGWPVVYLRLCGTKKDRSDLHRFFRKFWAEAEKAGFKDTYPLATDTWADVEESIKPRRHDLIFDKTGYSGFSNPKLESSLGNSGVESLVMTGLATSQCVDTTARDASDRGFSIVHVSDAQADYSEEAHRASLYASCGVCGANIFTAAKISKNLNRVIQSIQDKER
jgi:biuret amidohydrolase